MKTVATITELCGYTILVGPLAEISIVVLKACFCRTFHVRMFYAVTLVMYEEKLEMNFTAHRAFTELLFVTYRIWEQLFRSVSDLTSTTNLLAVSDMSLFISLA